MPPERERMLAQRSKQRSSSADCAHAACAWGMVVIWCGKCGLDFSSAAEFARHDCVKQRSQPSRTPVAQARDAALQTI